MSGGTWQRGTWLDHARLDCARLGKARQGKARQRSTGRDLAKQGFYFGLAWSGMAWQLLAGRDKVSGKSMTPKSIIEISADTRLLYQRLMKLQPDEVISYKVLSDIIGRDVCGRARGNLGSARRMAERDGIVTSCVWKEGVKRLTDAENVNSSGAVYRQRIRKAGNRTIRKMATVDFQNLSAEDKIRHNAEISQIGTIVFCAGEDRTERLKGKVSESISGQLAIAHTLRAFEEDK